MTAKNGAGNRRGMHPNSRRNLHAGAAGNRHLPETERHRRRALALDVALRLRQMLACRLTAEQTARLAGMFDGLDVTDATHLDAILARVVGEAHRGQQWAIECLLDRVFGRPRQQLEVAMEARPAAIMFQLYDPASVPATPPPELSSAEVLSGVPRDALTRTIDVAADALIGDAPVKPQPPADAALPGP